MNKIEFKNEGKKIELKIYGEIGDYYAKYDEERSENAVSTLEDLEKQLKDNKDASIIDIYINSTGGSVFDGIAIYNMLKRHRAYKRVFIEGFACSIASVIAMAGNSIVMPKSSIMMIHNAWCVGMGNANEFRKLAEDLDKINECVVNAYASKTKMEASEIKALMDKESYLTADECLEKGFCSKVDETLEETDDVEKALDEHVGLYQNKLETLNRIKNAISSINASEEVEAIEVEEEIVEAEETANETPIVDEETPVEEVVEEVVNEDSKETEIANENEIENEVENIKEMAMKSFFNVQ